MSTESTPAPQTGVAEDGHKGPRIAVSALVTNLRDYGLILALIAIMIFFQFTTNGTLFKPVNLSNLVQQNSFIIVMALGMLLVIVSGHIDLSVGSVAGFIGALAAMMMVIWPLGFLSNPLVVSIGLLIGGAIGAAQGYWVAYHRIPSFIVTLAGMLIFRGMCQALLGGGSSTWAAAARLQGAELRLHPRSDRNLDDRSADCERRRQDHSRQRRLPAHDDDRHRHRRRAGLHLLASRRAALGRSTATMPSPSPCSP